MPKVSLTVDGVEIVSADVPDSAVEAAKLALSVAEYFEFPKWLHHPDGGSKIVESAIEEAEHLAAGWFGSKAEAASQATEVAVPANSKPSLATLSQTQGPKA